MCFCVAVSGGKDKKERDKCLEKQRETANTEMCACVYMFDLAEKLNHISYQSTEKQK